MSKPKRKPQRSEWEDLLYAQLKSSGTPLPVRQYEFAKCIGRKFRADAAWLDERLVVEINGGIWRNGRHNTGIGYENDMERNALAVGLGFRVMQFSPRHVRSGWALQMIRVALGLDDLTREMTRAKEWR